MEILSLHLLIKSNENSSHLWWISRRLGYSTALRIIPLCRMWKIISDAARWLYSQRKEEGGKAGHWFLVCVKSDSSSKQTGEMKNQTSLLMTDCGIYYRWSRFPPPAPQSEPSTSGCSRPGRTAGETGPGVILIKRLSLRVLLTCIVEAVGVGEGRNELGENESN